MMALDCLLKHPSMALVLNDDESDMPRGSRMNDDFLDLGISLPAQANARTAGAKVVSCGRPSIRSRRPEGDRSPKESCKGTPVGPGKRSSMYRGVTRHRWTGKYEAHLWDKDSWNSTQQKRGKQVYLGAYDEEVVAARAYDLAALKYWGPSTLINFPVANYSKDLEEMQKVSREEYLASLRRKSSGFSRGLSKYRGVARHHHNGRWEARIGRVFGNKYLYLGTYRTQEEATTAYDLAAIEYRGLKAVTNFDLSHYIKWLSPKTQSTEDNFQVHGQAYTKAQAHILGTKHSLGFRNREQQAFCLPQKHRRTDGPLNISDDDWTTQQKESARDFVARSKSCCKLSQGLNPPSQSNASSSASSALSLLLQSSTFKQMLEKVSETPEIPNMNDYGIGSLDVSECDDIFTSQQLVDDFQIDIMSHDNSNVKSFDGVLAHTSGSIYACLANEGQTSSNNTVLHGDNKSLTWMEFVSHFEDRPTQFESQFEPDSTWFEASTIEDTSSDKDRSMISNNPHWNVLQDSLNSTPFTNDFLDKF